jgi:hypothetical protein
MRLHGRARVLFGQLIVIACIAGVIALLWSVADRGVISRYECSTGIGLAGVALGTAVALAKDRAWAGRTNGRETERERGRS